MKRLLSIVLVLGLCLCVLNGCGADEQQGVTEPATSGTAPDVPTDPTEGGEPTPSQPENPVVTEVTGDEWKAAMAVDKFTNVSLDYYEEQMENDAGEMEWLVIHYWFDGEWMRYAWSFEDESEDEVIENKHQDDMYDILTSEDVASVMSTLTDLYAQFEYDAQSKTYFNSQDSIRVGFEDGEVVLVVGAEGTSDEIRMEFFDYGTTKVTPPAGE